MTVRVLIALAAVVLAAPALADDIYLCKNAGRAMAARLAACGRLIEAGNLADRTLAEAHLKKHCPDWGFCPRPMSLIWHRK